MVNCHQCFFVDVGESKCGGLWFCPRSHDGGGRGRAVEDMQTLLVWHGKLFCRSADSAHATSLHACVCGRLRKVDAGLEGRVVRLGEIRMDGPGRKGEC